MADTITTTVYDDCRDCGGTGRTYLPGWAKSLTCEVCDGTGSVIRRRTVSRPDEQTTAALMSGTLEGATRDDVLLALAHTEGDEAAVLGDAAAILRELEAEERAGHG